MLAFRRLLSLLSADAASAEKNEYFSRGPFTVWLAVFFLGAFAEEFWRAFYMVRQFANPVPRQRDLFHF
jgi:hypothetical protein